MTLIVGDNKLRKAIERYFEDGTSYTDVLLEKSREGRKAIAEAVERRARQRREKDSS